MAVVNQPENTFVPVNTQVGPNMGQVNKAPPTTPVDTAGSKYSVNALAYPLNLNGTPDLQHTVVFHINIRGASKYVNSYKNLKAIDTASQTGRVNSNALGKNVKDVAQIVATGAGGYIGAKGAAGVLANLGGKAGAITKTVGVVGGAVAGGVLANQAMNAFSADQTYRTESSISLAVTERPSVRYGVDYASADLGAAAHLLQSGGSVTDVLTGKGMNSELARQIMLNVASIPSNLAGVGDPKALLDYGTGTTPNPFRAQMFKSVDNRVFVFEYKFLPRTAAESETVRQIIHKFKYHMHPEISPGGYYFIYPSEFDIEYYYRGKTNSFVNKISTCVLESLSVDYGGQGGFHSFADGSPTEVNMRLQFKELEVLTKERISQGY